MPSARDEQWRFASVGRLSIDDYNPAAAPDATTLAALDKRSDLVSDRAGRSVYVDDEPAAFEGISEELAAKATRARIVELAVCRAAR